MSHEPLLTINKLSFDYPGNKLFTDFSATIYPGLTMIQGEDGCGKTTLLKLLTGRLPISNGELKIAGIDSIQQEVAFRKLAFWIDAQSEEFEHTTVESYFSTLAENYQKFQQEHLRHAIEGLSLATHLEKQFFMLSTGTRRKVWLAAALSVGCPVIALDDPFAGVDQRSTQFFCTNLQQQPEKSQQAWIIASHIALDVVVPTTIIELS